MKHSRITIITALTVAVVGVAIWALAGYLMDNGAVTPDIGWKDETEFTYTVSYWRSPDEEAPDVLILAYWKGLFEWDEMMYIDNPMSIPVNYWYTTTLDKAGNWGFKFEVVGGETSNMHLGPSVFERP